MRQIALSGSQQLRTPGHLFIAGGCSLSKLRSVCVSCVFVSVLVNVRAVTAVSVRCLVTDTLRL